LVELLAESISKDDMRQVVIDRLTPKHVRPCLSVSRMLAREP
jgi:hypothetical protein